MKTIKVLVLLSAALAVFGADAAAKDAMTGDTQVFMTSLNARQRYPWNGKVDIDFAFTSTVPDAFAFIQFTASYVNAGGETVEVPMRTFDQITLPWCTNAGTYRVTWDSTADAPGLVVTNMKYRVTANMAKYMVIDLSSGKDGASWPITYYEDVPSFPGVEAGKWDDYHKTTNLVLRLVQPGEFKECWGDWNDDRRYFNIHTSILTQPYYLAVFELTQEQHYLMNGLYGYEPNAVMLYTGGNRKVRPSVDAYKRIRGSGLPNSDNINWPITGSAVGADSLINLIRQKTGSEFFDLPTDSEWEYACRCGGAASGFWNDASDAGIDTATKLTTIVDGNATLATLGRYRYNGGMVRTWDDVGQTNIYTTAAFGSDESLGTAVVGSYAPNAWGFYDMHGNVPEWCCCAMSRDWRSTQICTNDVGRTVASWNQYQQRVYRGGGINTPAWQCTIPFRNGVSEANARGIRLCWRFPTPAQGNDSMSINLGYAAAALALTFGGNLVAGEPAKKYIFASWELGDVTPQELLANVDAFDRTGCDGVSWQLQAVLPGASRQCPRHVMEKPVWADKELDSLAPIFTELAKHPSMRHSFFGVNMAPKTSRLRWDDDMVWHVLATNMATLARFARKVGAVGIIMDFEDYWRKQQYRWVEGDPAYDEALKLARRRGKEVFEGAFDAYPKMTVLSFHLFTDDWEYPRVRDPKSLMRAKRDLFPAFLNGLLDATPPGAKIVDGFERSYSAKASIKTFYRIVRDQNQGIIQLVEPENREKYKVCHSTGFGMFVDAYSDFVKTNSVWYLGPVRGKRTVHLEENLRQATECADEYVWFWGQRGFWIDWPEDLKDPSWRDVFGHSWRKKYVCSKVGRFRPWREILDGDFDMILRGVKDPDGCARAEYERQVAEGSLVAVGPSKPMVSKNGRIIIRAGGLVEDGWYGIALKMKGDDDVDALWFRYQGKARWTLGPVCLAFGPKDEEGWRQAFTLLRVPEGTKMISIESIDDVVKRGLSFDGLAVFNIKH